MKCLILSDSHGSAHSVGAALRMHPDAEVVFFLGDGLSDIKYAMDADNRASERMFLSVKGNCDFSAPFLSDDVKKTDSITLLSHKIVFTHGDLYGAKLGTGGLLTLAENEKCGIVLFGHTHMPHYEYKNGIHLFNPGSVRMGYGGLLTLTERDILFSHISTL